MVLACHVWCVHVNSLFQDWHPPSPKLLLPCDELLQADRASIWHLVSLISSCFEIFGLICDLTQDD